MDILDLGGEWSVSPADGKWSIKAAVPGGVHNDLLNAKRIPEPFYRDNEQKVAWVGETDWVYTRDFTVSAEIIAREKVLLQCDGLDTVARIEINGALVGKTDNMFRTWEFDVKPRLRAGTNTISITFTSAMAHVRKMNRKEFLPAWGVGQFRLDGGGWIRKQPCNFGWDWGPALVTCGIWRGIRIAAFDTARLTDIHIRQNHARGAVTLSIAASVQRAGRGSLRAVVSVSHAGKTVTEADAVVRGGRAVVSVTVRDPKLWWPNGMGGQPLYEVTVDLVGADGELLDTGARRIGLRTLELQREKDKWGESFRFAVNGKAFFAKGANWIPADAILARLTHADYARLLADAVAANMNMLRAWGGGIYEHDMFYDLCDELGICVWQDFIFSCGTYPTFDAGFMANVRAEAEDNVRRIRHHACVALWCGNNELEQGLVGDEWTKWTMSWDDYKKLFDVLLPDVVKRLDPDRPYWPCSPHSPVGDRKDFNNASCGDAHLWSVWHGRKPFEWYRTCEHRFNSEFGFQSFPEPRTVHGYTRASDRNITSPIMELHQRSGIGNDAIVQYMLSWYRLPTTFDSLLWTSQILQGMAIKYAVEHWRRSMPRGMGTLYWQINDCWPVASWASIDSHGNWKALHYMARRFFAPVLVSGLEDMERGTVEVHVTNDRLAGFSGNAAWTLTNIEGRRLARGAFPVKIGERKSAKVGVIDASEVARVHGRENLLIWLDLVERGRTISDNLVLLARPKSMDLPLPRWSVGVKARGECEFTIKIKSPVPALWAWVEAAGVTAKYSDRFMHVKAGEPVEVGICTDRPMTADALRGRLRVRSLVDTYS
ncbi:MAG: glycoside hydrolase family 2 protein [Lentisphaerae bacterium]|nr:glycoside hydrolase family 2 protein [Lentisphaerota bacterium]